MSKLLIRQQAGGGYQWQRLGDNGQDAPGNGSGSGDFDALRNAINGQQTEMWLMLPGEHFFIKKVEYSDREKRHLRHTVPYQVEELLVDEIEELHFALGEPRDGEVSVASCRRDWLNEQLQPFLSAEIDLARVVPDSLLLARSSGWSLRLTGKNVLAHTGEGEGFMMEPNLALTGLGILRGELDQDIIPVSVSASNQQALDDFSESLQAVPGLQIDRQVKTWWQSIDVTVTPEIDLRQGEFGRRLPINRWWQQWRNVAVFAGITLGIYLVVSAVQYNILDGRNLELRQQIEREFRSVVPRGVIVDAERQLRNKVNSLQGTSGSSSAMSTLAMVAPVVAANEEVTLRALHYNGDGSEMRLSFWAQTFNAIEQVRAKIAELGMDVELVQASADGDGHQARLRIRELAQRGTAR